ncbi:MAG: hypothetical protein K2Q26_06415 [Bdellovibrionales bacterium]|nr:hypothetical protein [Bdellovibrionales bacterium]
MLKASLFGLLLLAGTQAYAVCPEGTTAKQGQIESKPICVVRGSYLNANISLTANNAYVLEGDVRIGGDNVDKSTLTLEPGTQVYGSSGAYLVVSRGSQIFANGTASKPVVFTALERQNPVPGFWGGLVITGNASINNCKGAAQSCDNTVEGIQTNAPKFGGNNDDESSGRLNYVRVEYAGYTLAEDNELNAITFYAVGRGTEVDYIEAYKGADDGVELFGGTVNIRHVVIIDNDDDGLDWDMGWRGNAQFVLIQLENATEKDPNGIEADNLKSPMTAEPRSNPTISNVTIIGKGTNPKLLNGILLRHGTAGKIFNTIVTGTFQNCVNIDNEETFKVGGQMVNGKVEQTGLVMSNSIVSCSGTQFKEDATDLWSVSQWFSGDETKSNYVMDPQLKDWIPGEDSPAVGGAVDELPELPGQWQFIPVSFVGALSSKNAQDWTAGWTKK